MDGKKKRKKVRPPQGWGALGARDGQPTAAISYSRPEAWPQPACEQKRSNPCAALKATLAHLLYRRTNACAASTHDPQYAKTPRRDEKTPGGGYLNSSAYTLDPRGSITATYDAGNLTEQYHYTAYGVLYDHESLSTQADQDDTVIASIRGYNGKPTLAGGQLYNYGYRDYDPSTGIFLTIDPIRDGENWYAYVGGDPVNFIDPLGLEKTVWEAIKSIAKTASQLPRQFVRGVKTSVQTAREAAQAVKENWSVGIYGSASGVVGGGADATITYMPKANDSWAVTVQASGGYNKGIAGGGVVAHGETTGKTTSVEITAIVVNVNVSSYSNAKGGGASIAVGWGAGIGMSVSEGETVSIKSKESKKNR